MVVAIETIEAGESYRAVATDTPNVTRQILSTIMGDDGRKGRICRRNRMINRLD